jgi:hypothetical protein
LAERLSGSIRKPVNSRLIAASAMFASGNRAIFVLDATVLGKLLHKPLDFLYELIYSRAASRRFMQGGD